METRRIIDKYKIIVIGAGHAGVEAGLASARLGNKTLLVTLNLDSIAFMACNPNIGGTAKGHLVREIDALGGEMGVNADKSLVQIRLLNSGKGAAVQSLRGQADKLLYHSNMKATVEKQELLDILQAEIKSLIVEKGEVKGCITAQGTHYRANSIIIATGVYLNSKIIMGEYSKNTGPNGYESAVGLTESLIENGVKIARFKTGTPARIKKSSIDFAVMELQEGDNDIYSFSEITTDEITNKMPCYLTYTTAKTKEIILNNLDKAPMYNGSINGVGPRYCPSIEDKVVRFKDKERHQVFIEPEGLNTDEYYVQGVSTSLPVDVQEEMYKSIIGLENCVIMRYAYAIEYDCIDPLELTPYLMLKKIKGVFTAGQINGSSGYEEAAAQGLIAGINASRYINDLEPIVLRRDQAYIGVLIDDLVTKGTNEPYRMMTARAEYRLFLRQDNADVRLTELGRTIGLVNDYRYNLFLEKQNKLKEIRTRLNRVASPKEFKELFEHCGESQSNNGIVLKDILKRNNINSVEFKKTFHDEFGEFDINLLRIVEIDIKYEGYLKKQQSVIDEIIRLENTALPINIDYTKVDGLRLEAREKLNKIKPMSLAQASRISGVNNADITVLMVYLTKIRGVNA